MQPSDASSAETREPISISVIIPALNEADMIGGCLESLAQSDFPADRFEVIVADNGSTDNTVEVAESYAHRLQLTVLKRPAVTVSRLRNLGAATARGEILAFLDADCLAPRDWLRNLQRHSSAEGSGVVGGYIAILPDSRWVARAWYGSGYAPRSGEVSYVPAGNLAMQRASFLKIGGFGQELRTAEDFDLCLRARGAGFPVRGAAELAVLHLRTPQTLMQFYKRERWHGAHVGKTLLKNIRNWVDFRACAFAAYMLFCTLLALAGLGLVWAAHRYELLLAALVGILAGAVAGTVFKLRTTRQRHRLALTFIQLSVLHIVYGMARARALISMQTAYPRNAISSLKEDAPWHP